jgi:hypothetical protein
MQARIGSSLLVALLGWAAGLPSNAAAPPVAGTVISWGDQVIPAVPPGARFTAIAAGGEHKLALKDDGTVVAWGDNDSGESAVPASLGSVIAIAAGTSHNLALKQDATVVGWGDDTYGQVTAPTNLPGTLVVAIAPGPLHSVALVAPVISLPPQTQTAEAGSQIGLYVGVNAAPPPTYQWLIDGTNAPPNATNSFLTLSNVQPFQSGSAYAVVVSGAFGVVTSDTAVLSVIPRVAHRVVPALSVGGASGGGGQFEYQDAFAPGALWVAITNHPIAVTPQFTFDLSDPLPPQRCYRAGPIYGPRPVASWSMATEIPLAGAIGSSVRIDYINQFGPTNAWVTLDTGLLTNSPQLYFDTTAFRRPTRLYRLVPVP